MSVPPASRSSSTSKMLDLFSVKECSSGTRAWTRIGSASVRRDGTLKLVFDVPPTDGVVLVSKPRPPRARA